VLLAGDYASMNRADDAMHEANMAMALRPNDALVMYNVSCCFCALGKKDEGLSALRKAYDAGFRDADWTRRDPDLALLRDDPEFERMYPAGRESGSGARRPSRCPLSVLSVPLW
jgi:hypothetical protein